MSDLDNIVSEVIVDLRRLADQITAVNESVKMLAEHPEQPGDDPHHELAIVVDEFYGSREWEQVEERILLAIGRLSAYQHRRLEGHP